LRISEDDGQSPRAQTTAANFHRDSDPIPLVSTGVSSDSIPSFDDINAEWSRLAEHPQPAGNPATQDVRRNMQSLVLGATNYSTADMNSAGYVNSENSNSADTGLSPDTTHSGSNRTTPNSSTPSEPRANLRPGHPHSGGPSYETSPALSHPRISADGGRTNGFSFGGQEYSTIPPTGMTPDHNVFAMDTPGRDYPAQGWDMTQQPSQGMTPVGEGVFRHLMGLGPSMDPMDMGWEGGS